MLNTGQKKNSSRKSNHSKPSAEVINHLHTAIIYIPLQQATGKATWNALLTFVHIFFPMYFPC